MFDALRADDLPCDVPVSPGAFYYFVKVRTGLDDLTLTERLIREHRVAVVPGSVFGTTDGCYVRVSYGALDEETAGAGIGRLVSGLKKICSE
jgi:aspartate/methionine/tyrosine aminotransferase